MSLSKRNRRGVWVLLITCITLSYIPRVIAGWNNSPLVFTHEDLDEAELKVDGQKSSRQKSYYKKQKQGRKYSAPSHKFDPNTYSKEDWMQLGLSGKQADVVLKFAKRGIRSNEDLQKIFVLPEQLFELIKDSTVYPQKGGYTQKIPEAKPERKIVDINSADFDELKSLPGIGDYYANKIIEYRDQLGGYHSAHQLLELWKFGTERYDKISDVIKTGDAGLKKININKAEIDELKAHPYISYKVANSIVKMRNAHGAYQNVRDLLRSDLIDEELLAKIQPYLTL